MRLYGKKFVNKYLKKQTRITAETRDGILWDVDWINKVTRVKIQGSDEYINVQFPRNEAARPSWLKEGNAVRVVHRTGNRGYAEIVGHGQAVPTPMPGTLEGPQEYVLPDGVISGGQISSTYPESMAIDISPGSYRIDGETYTLVAGIYEEQYMTDADPIQMSGAYPPATLGQETGIYEIMSDSTTWTMSDDFPEDMGADRSYTLDAAPATGYYRYDAFVVGTDGVIDYIAGTEATSNPVQPTIPVDHVQLGYYILVSSGVTEIAPDAIGAIWSQPELGYLEFEFEDDCQDLVCVTDEAWLGACFEWDDGDDTPEQDVLVNIRDQYGDNYSEPLTIVFTMMTGTGQIYSSDTGWHATTVSRRGASTPFGFKYQRDQTDNETSPYFRAEVYGNDRVFVHGSLTLLDEDCNIRKTAADPRDLAQELTSAASVAIDWAQGRRAEITISHDVAFSFSGALDQDKLIIMVRQDGTGGYTPTWPASVTFGNQIIQITIDETADTRSYVGFIYDQSTNSYDCVANVSGYL